MKIHQIQVRYDEVQDRILLRVSTTDQCEFRFWLTRRFVKRLWGMLLKMLEWDQAVRQQVNPQTRHAVLDIQHEGYARQGNYSQAFEEAAHRMPLGEAPVLLATAKGSRRDTGVQVLSLHPAQGQGIDMTLDTKLLHIFSKLLREAVGRADWDIGLELHEGARQGAPPGSAVPRRLN